MKRFWIVLLVLSFIAACAPPPQTAIEEAATAGVDLATDTLQAQDEPTATDEPIPTETLAPIASLDDEQFDQALVEAVETLDLTALRSLMRDRFLISNWQVDLNEYPSEEALQRLRESVFTQGAQPLANFSADVVALLSDTDPLTLWGPVANPVRALHVTGLGADTTQEAVLVVGRDEASGGLFWLGILLPRAGSFATRLPDPSEVAETEVEYVKALVDLNTRLGPGTDYEVVGLLKNGEVSQVTGVSLDGAWWRILCTFDASGICWISAAPDLSEPTTAP
jgi:hypothetical protein